MCPVETPYVEVGQISTLIYFMYFLVLVPVVGLIENRLIFANK
jgi:ubiquinol-cytochrome c reductase cytochrome b subunit